MASEDDKSEGEDEGALELGLSLNLDECFDEFCEPARILPFVRPKAKAAPPSSSSKSE